MKLYVAPYIEKLLKKADYGYDKKSKSWCASIDSLPGAYAQDDSVEAVRERLSEVIEDYILVSLRDRSPLPGFKKILPKMNA
ncbi:MAG: hypothetical protein COV31_02040 [Candidatus Yanofskybacteria bacterium CG10_big_fil_rev_8_21_14_0_10_46_23]|uniref:HicB family protein n=1 Tax=Candidatus Yanofskybacteria bacterium CG10_big_fil_rev_8_21_14_0_10_46_23 TaxID=1975098 RepID=A0A2H0R3S7_9BACT|nr:MAG: hypothetical protein COV31_02040 [Candidatus Yanofskybacteria bacterium CG10_big_fil_rev_8_21_14_0_10_46_23]